jgi:GNAT superfamily N-acetyltransferase
VYQNDDGIKAAIFGNIEVWYDQYHYQLKEMYVDSELQRSGIGTMMMKKLTKELIVKHVIGIYLYTSSTHWTSGFYQKNGFSRVKKMQMMHMHLYSGRKRAK